MRIIFILTMVLPFALFAQISDNFSDGNFTANPTWSGDNANYIISSSTSIPTNMRPGLQTANTVSATTYLSVGNVMALSDSLEWSFWAKMSFNPSASNFGRIYLVSDSAKLTGDINGYYVSLSYAGIDRLHLVKQDGNNHSVLIVGTSANLNKSTNTLRIKVLRDNVGNWTMLSDTLGGENFLLEGSALDASFINTNFFGIYTQYTSSNATKFYFDDFYVGPIIKDTIAPVVSKINIVGPTLLDVYFSENIDIASAQTISNYNINNNIGQPLVATVDNFAPSLVHLILQNPIEDGILYEINISDIKDHNNNVMLPQSIAFARYEPNAYDVVINEIMADPSPPVLLPDYEYIELYNKTAIPINLKDFVLSIGTSNKVFGDVTIDAHGYLILCHDNAKQDLSVYGKTYGFSSFSISNTGVNISLQNPLKSIISFAEFTSDWYKSPFKSDGGWSVEQIDPNNPCEGTNNWAASINSKGGTPGAKNSIDGNLSDNTTPQLLRISIENDSNIRVWYSEPMDSSKVLNPANYEISGGLSIYGVPKGISPQYKNILLPLKPKIEHGIVYTLSIKDTISDCIGNLVPISSSARFAKSDSLEVGDLVINEVLYDPVVGVDDYIEIVNRSSKIIDLRFITIATMNDSLKLKDQSLIAPNGYTMFPSEYVAFTKTRTAVINHYAPIAPKQILEISKMPSYSNDKGIVVLATAAGVVLDILKYNSKMQDPILKSVDGVALERIDYNRPTIDETNWHSAASSANYGTPGYKNSQFSQYEGDGKISVSPESFSPDNDGYNDVLNIAWKFEKPGIVCNMKIFDSNGRFAKDIFKNEPIGPEGSVSWDGKDENGQKAPIGIYIIYTSVFTTEGYTEKFKTVVVVTSKF